MGHDKRGVHRHPSRQTARQRPGPAAATGTNGCSATPSTGSFLTTTAWYAASVGGCPAKGSLLRCGKHAEAAAGNAGFDPASFAIADRAAAEAWAAHFDALGVHHSEIRRASRGWVVDVYYRDGLTVRLYRQVRAPKTSPTSPASPRRCSALPAAPTSRRRPAQTHQARPTHCHRRSGRFPYEEPGSRAAFAVSRTSRRRERRRTRGRASRRWWTGCRIAIGHWDVGFRIPLTSVAPSGLTGLAALQQPDAHRVAV